MAHQRHDSESSLGHASACERGVVATTRHEPSTLRRVIPIDQGEPRRAVRRSRAPHMPMAHPVRAARAHPRMASRVQHEDHSYYAILLAYVRVRGDQREE